MKTVEAPLIAALIKEGVVLVEAAEKTEPTNSSLIQFKEYLKQAQEATTPEARSDALIGMEGLESEVRSIAKMPAPEVEEIKLSGRMIEIPLVEGKAIAPEGTCFEDAWRFQIRQEEGILIHGEVTGANGITVKHAWVELPTGFIYEPQTARFFKSEVFKSAFSPKEDARYTVEEAAIMAAKIGQHGPWTKEEKDRAIGKGELLECMICHQKFDHLIIGTCESCYKKWTGGK